MKLRKLAPEKIILGFRQVIFTFSQTSRLVWSANRKLLIAALGINVLSGLLVLPGFYLNKLVIDGLVKNIGNPLWQKALGGLIFLFLLRVLISLFQNVTSIISRNIQVRVARIFDAHVGILLGQKYNQLDMETLEDPEFKNRYTKVERESGRRSWQLAMTLSQIPNYFFSLLSAFSLLFFFNPVLALVIFVLSIPEFLVDAKYTKLEYQLETSFMPKYRMWGWLDHLLTRARNILEIRILDLSDYLIEREKKLQKEIYNESFKLKTRREKAHFFTFIPQSIFSFFFSIYLGILTISRAITVGSFQMYLQAIYSFQGSLTGLVSEFLDLYENFLFVTDLIWFINTEPKITSGKKKFPDRVRRGLEFRDVWFRYKPDQPWILKGINLQLAARENLAIVGENGAGKTTLIKLLCRFYDPQKGEILVDGINLKEFDRSSLWKNLTVLFQNFEGFPFTARESIGYGRVENVEDIALVTQSAKQSTIHEFIAGLPLRYENPLTTDFEKGVEPSGGQWQRIGLARVLFRRAQVVILDEPTSNVDPKSEEEIFEKIMELTAKKNLILISHRFSTVRRANKICVIDKGQITEMGTHEELIKKRKLYAELFNLQAKAYH